MTQDKAYLSYCPKCGHQGIYETGTEKCPFCGTKEKPTEYDWDEWLWGNKYPHNLEEIIFNTYVKPSEMFNAEFYRQRINKEKIQNSNNKTSISNVPHCPTCGSTNVRKITTAEKATGVFLFGIFSNKRNCQFECQNPKCKYKW